MRVEVSINGAVVGVLEHDSTTSRFSFIYSTEWLKNEDRFALSPNLPLEPTPSTVDAHSASVRLFFENLLPEGQALEDASTTNQISKSNVMGLLIAIGKETSGAISIRLPGTSEHDGNSSLRPLPLEELSERIRARPHQSFTVWDGKVRLSIAGYQDKIAVFRKNDEYFLAEGASYASTHILKPEPVRDQLAGLTSNEYFCLLLAGKIGLPTANAELIHVPEPVLAVTRFDRQLIGNGVRRLHIIDGCQVLGLSSGFKYERPHGDHPDVRHIRDGASFPRLFETLNRYAATPAAQRLQLLRWAIFQVLIGNTDAHAKNLSFFINSTGLSIAPAYDMVCGLAFQTQGLDTTYAMAIGDAFSPEELSPFEWANFANQCNLNPKLVGQMIKAMSGALLSLLEKIKSQAITSGSDPEHLESVAMLIRNECNHHRKFADEIHKVPKSIL